MDAVTEPTLSQLRDRLRDFRDARDWEQFHTLKDLAAAITVEAAELQEIFLWQQSGQDRDVLGARKADIEGELADVLIHVLNFSLAADVDLIAAVERKIEVNESRYPADKARGRSTKYTSL